MKNISVCFFALFFFIIISCKNKAENDVNVDADKVSTESYLTEKVGDKNDDAYVVSNPELIRKEWEENLLTQDIKVKLADIKIISGMIDETSEVFYMLVAKSEDGKTKTASLLTLKNNEFYFDIQPEKFVMNVICRGNCEEGCDPRVVVQNNMKLMVCSPCSDCQKVDYEMR